MLEALDFLLNGDELGAHPRVNVRRLHEHAFTFLDGDLRGLSLRVQLPQFRARYVTEHRLYDLRR